MAQTLCGAGVQKQLFLRTTQVPKCAADLFLQARHAAL